MEPMTLEQGVEELLGNQFRAEKDGPEGKLYTVVAVRVPDPRPDPMAFEIELDNGLCMTVSKLYANDSDEERP